LLEQPNAVTVAITAVIIAMIAVMIVVAEWTLLEVLNKPQGYTRVLPIYYVPKRSLQKPTM
jgi:hypothetical protein